MKRNLILLHIVSRADWDVARHDDFYSPPSLKAEGFIHLSTPEQALLPANRFYKNRTDLVLLVIATEKLTASLRYEAADGDVYPHLHGSLNTDAVIEVAPFPPDDDGGFSALPEISTLRRHRGRETGC